MDTLALVLACFSLVLAVASFGIALTARRRLARPALPEVQPICGCTHHASYHDETGCHFIDLEGYRQETECGCRKYMGPEPLPEAYLP